MTEGTRVMGILKCRILMAVAVGAGALFGSNEGGPGMITATVSAATSTTRIVGVRALIEGSDFVHVQGNKIWYTHRNQGLPGTSLSGDAPGATYVDEEAWMPVWAGLKSDKFDKLSSPPPPLAVGDATMVLTDVHARGTARVVQQPSASNCYETIVLLDDDGQSGSAWYEFTLRREFTPASATVNREWRATGVISDGRGLELEDVALGSRAMAARMSTPYVSILTTSHFRPVVHLYESGGPDPSYKSRLVNFGVSPPTGSGNGTDMVIEATYLVDELDGRSSCITCITQQYEFRKVIGGGCEPSEESPAYIPRRLSYPLRCAPWRPKVTYRFFPGDDGEALRWIKVHQRFDFNLANDGGGASTSGNSAVLILDCDDQHDGTASSPCYYPYIRFATVKVPRVPLPIPVPLGVSTYPVPGKKPRSVPGMGLWFPKAPGLRLINPRGTRPAGPADIQPPLTKEMAITVVQDGTPLAFADSYHQTYNQKVDLPTPFPPGCPECVHLHWRWGKFSSPEYGGGGFLGGAGHTLEVAVVRYDSREADEDENYKRLANGESLVGSTPVFWHVTTAPGPAYSVRRRGNNVGDIFAYYGFFSPDPTPAANFQTLFIQEVTSRTNALVGELIKFTTRISKPAQPQQSIQAADADDVHLVQAYGDEFAELVGVVASQGTCTDTPGLINCSLGPMAADATATVEVTLRATAPGLLTSIVFADGNRQNNAVALTTIR